MKPSRLFTAIVLFAAQNVTIALGQEIMCHLPKTLLRLEVTYEVTTAKHGPFYQYSERYLGTKDVVTQDKTSYNIVNVEIGTGAIADPVRTFSFIPGQDGLTTFSLSRDGMLQSLNANDQTTGANKKNENSNRKKPSENSVMPLSEEVLLTGSIAKMAEGTAKQIYRLREARLNLLSGDVDKLPADANSMHQVLAEIERQEKELTSLFIGTIKKEVKHEKIIISEADLQSLVSAEGANEIIAFRFSPIVGLVDAEDLSGAPFYLKASNISRAEKPINDKKSPALSPIKYCVPGSATFMLTDGKKTIKASTLLLSALGYDASLPADFIKKSPVLHFDRRTGALLSAEQHSK